MQLDGTQRAAWSPSQAATTLLDSQKTLFGLNLENQEPQSQKFQDVIQVVHMPQLIPVACQWHLKTQTEDICRGHDVEPGIQNF
jgi:hypothetical protein